MLGALIRQLDPGRIVITFDLSKSKYRLGKHPEYKKRKWKDNDPMRHQILKFYEQLTVLQEVLAHYPVSILGEEIVGWEADDAIAYIVSQFNAGKYSAVHKVNIISADKDLCALVGKQVNWYDPLNEKLVTESNFKETFGVAISQFPDYKAIKGDPGDNIPHVNGMGEKLAIKLLTEYGTLAKMMELKVERVLQHQAVLNLAYDLVRLDLHDRFPEDPVWKNIDNKLLVEPGFNKDRLIEIYQILSFKSVLEEFPVMSERWNLFFEAGKKLQ